MTSQNAGIEVIKTADTERSKVGNTINYTIIVRNTGDTTLSRISVADSLLGPITQLFPESLAPGQEATVTVPYIVLETDPDPLENTVMAIYRTTLIARDSVNVDLFNPAVTVEKTGPSFSKVGDTVTYTFTVTNTSSSDSPNLILDSVIDDLFGDLTQTAFASGWSNLPPGAVRTFSVNHTVTGDDPDPLVNTVTVNYHPEGFANILSASDQHIVDLVHPDFSVNKFCFRQPAVAGGTATFQVDITNTGDVPLTIVAVDQGVFYRNDRLQPGNVFSFLVNVPVPSASNGTCPREVGNTVNVTATVAEFEGGLKLPNEIQKSAVATCPVVVRGRATGFWQSNPGQAILDPDQDGNINPPVLLGTSGVGLRSLSVSRIAQSNTILINRYCSLPGSNCTNRSSNLQQNTMEKLIAQTLALTYNIRFLPCYNNQIARDLACRDFLEEVGLPVDATVNDVLATANGLIGSSNSIGLTTQAQAKAVIRLLECLNRES
ncbi:hypothetical protein [Bacillus sp. B15-48]|uniref:DUF7507 domain-containing protein n=1 Tax=Bacillus sp. B15-48 TaxID=1548601 RepID=UPI00193EC36D|nr:hypothetical protein [Bacillus sp. B15-48]MBM4762951.1 hypothetical protein [Bacillus sp. B15-48]